MAEQSCGCVKRLPGEWAELRSALTGDEADADANAARDDDQGYVVFLLDVTDPDDPSDPGD